MSIRFVYVLAIALSLLVSANTALARNAQETPETSHILPALYAERLFLKHLISSYGKDDAAKLESLKSAEAAILAFVDQTKVYVRASSLAELSEVERRYFSSQWSLSDELGFRTRSTPPYMITVPAAPNVAERLERYRQDHAALLSAPLAAAGLPIAQISPARAADIRRLLIRYVRDPQGAHQAFALVPAPARLSLVAAVHAGVARALQRIDSTGEAFSHVGSVQLPIPGLDRFLTITLDEYFRHLTLESKLDIIADLLDRPATLTPQEQFEVMVMNAGPQFQKLFQAFAREKGFGEELATVLKKLEQNTKPIPWRLVQPIITSQPVPFDWISIDHQPLGVGSMAQVHRAMIRDRDGIEKAVVVRVLKPGIRERMKRDSEVLSQLAPILDADATLSSKNFPKMTPYLREIDEMMTQELRIETTSANQKRGAEVYERMSMIQTASGHDIPLHLHVPKIYELADSKEMMVQEFVSGTSFEKFAQQEPELALGAVDKLARMWIEEALLKSGFYHADLHQGNLRVSRESNKVTVNLLDFGMAGQINEHLQNRFLTFGLVSQLNDGDLLARALWGLTAQEKNRITLAELKHLLVTEMRSRADRGIHDTPFFEWVAIAANSGLHFPSEFTSLNRGVALIYRMLEDHGLKLDLAELVKSNLIHNPARVNRVMTSNPLISRTEWMKAVLTHVRGSGSTPQSAMIKDMPASDKPSTRTSIPTINRCEAIFAAAI